MDALSVPYQAGLEMRAGVNTVLVSRGQTAVPRRGLSIVDYKRPRRIGSGTLPIGQLCSHFI